jgi:hypothetical protein
MTRRGFLRARARRAENGNDGMSWDDPAKMAHCLLPLARRIFHVVGRRDWLSRT